MAHLPERVGPMGRANENYTKVKCLSLLFACLVVALLIVVIVVVVVLK